MMILPSAIDVALGWARDNWVRPTAGIVAAAGFATTAALAVYKLGFENHGWPEVIVGALTALAVIVVWYASNRVPRHPRGRVGIGIAIRSYTDEQSAIISTEFVEAVRRLAERGSAESSFSVVEIPRRFVPIKQTTQWVDRIAVASGSRYLLYGHATERVVKGESVHALLLDGFVTHGPVPEEVSKGLGREFRSLLPRHFLIGKDGDIIALEVAGRCMLDVATFIVAMAAALSADFTYSAFLLRDLQQRLDSLEPEALGPIQAVKNAIPSRLAAVLLGHINRQHGMYWSTGDSSFLLKAEPLADELLIIDPAHYNGKLIKAMCQFVLRRDVTGAIATLSSCDRCSEITWRLSLAFLRAYSGDLDAAYREYVRAFGSPAQDGALSIQIEEFIHRVLQEEPDKGQLWYCLGLINYRGKGDLLAARADLERFLKETKDNQYSVQRDATRKWLGKIYESLGDHRDDAQAAPS